MPFDRRWCSTRLLERCLVWVVLGWPSAAAASPPEVRLETSARVGLPAEELAPLEAALTEAARRGVQEAGAVEQADAPARLVVEVAWKDERQIDYVGRIELRELEDPKAAPLVIRTFGCEMCGASDLVVRLQSEVALALGTVVWPAPGPEATPAAEPVASEDDATRRARARLRPLGFTGVGVASVGVVSIVAGAVLWSRDDRLVLRPGDPTGPVWKRSWRPPGIGLTAGGVGAVLVGSALVIVDVARGRRRVVAMEPCLERGFAGLQVKGRF